MSALAAILPRGYLSATRAFVLLAAVSLLFADLAVTTMDPFGELRRMFAGLAAPDFAAIAGWSVVSTLAFAVVGVTLGAGAGFLLAIVFARSRTVRIACALVRSVHELFWALLLMQVFGLSAITGVLAIALPYAGICAKVYSEMIEEADLSALVALPKATSTVSAFFYARLPDLAVRMKTYTLYRLECAMRSTLVLGFIGLPTMGFYLESAFRQGRYAEAGALLLVFYVLIGSRRLWARARTLPLLFAAAILALPSMGGSGDVSSNLLRFGRAIMPAPLRNGDWLSLETWSRFGAWLRSIVTEQILPGALETLVLSQLALVATGAGALALLPLVSRRFTGRLGQPLGRILLVVVRSTPEYVLAYVLLQLFGPSMLPAIIALSIHNAGIIGYLMGRHVDGLAYRPDAPRGVNLYAYEVVPRAYGQFLAYLLYRWEIILRESAIFGILGVATLGFHVDAAISELRLDVAVVLILATGCMAIAVDALSRALRKSLRIERLPVRLSTASIDRA
ncbi:PhnE/PtxC family ABC transporter permease [Hansschlegelia quercus]|uniref:ABC transporter permease n=1 Tax=Hansschlegelia quercus TaxID=2528245 RepID=A0A4Q9G9X2_9HYPH|nr:ABC transporter permease [Hansschlegelia quercus]TBN47596.1 ABC transporter permease [Hansschlegelia quercus]